MGFGLLFIGYFIAFFMSINNYGFAFEIIGYAIMLSAIGKLSEYRHSLANSSLALLVMALCSVFDGFRYLDGLLSLNVALFRDSVTFTVSLLAAATSLVFHFLLLLSIRDIVRDAEEFALAKKVYIALGAAALSCILEFGLALFGNLPGFKDAPALAVFALVAALVRILYPFAVLAFTYSCYARVCAPDDVDMPKRPSRFAFVNRWRERQDKKAAETAQWRKFNEINVVDINYKNTKIGRAHV